MDKRDLLGQLKIDRDAEAPGRARRPLKWLLGLVSVGVLAFVAWFVGFPSDSAVPVRTAIATTAAASDPGTSVLDATGYVVARREATVSSKVTGKVVEVMIEEGMSVKEGQLLATLDDRVPRAQLALAESQLEAARAGLGEIKVQIRQAHLDLERTEGLAKRNLASQADQDRDRLAVEALEARLARARDEVTVAERSAAVERQMVEDMKIRAPFSGIVIAKAAQPGEMISPISAGGGFTRTGICTLVDMDSLEVEVDVNEAYINRVQPEQPVKVTLNAYPNDGLPARVIAIIPAADRTKATVRVRIGLLDRDPRVLPDMGVKVAFLEEQKAADAAPPPAGVLVPKEAVGRDATGEFVWVVQAGAASRRAVTVGERQGSRVLVSRGLAQGERVVAPLDDDLPALLAEGGRVAVVN